MPDEAFERVLQSALVDRREQQLHRRRRIIRAIDATHVEVDGRRLVNFCSNNYLGLTHHPAVIAAMERATREHGAGAGASALISGYTPAHASAEAALAKWKGTEAAALLPSGYQTNHAVIQTLASVALATNRRVRFLLDKLVHASLIDAVIGTGTQFGRFGHNDLARLEQLLRETPRDELTVVVTESIFSMDGDAAPLAGIAELKREYNFVLLLDEAHASGVYGPGGAGYAAECGLSNVVDVFVVTLSKAIGCIGGAVCGSKTFIDALVNFGRAYIYSTSTPPAVAAACEGAIEVMKSEPHRQQRLRAIAKRVRSEFHLEGDSPIIPVIVGDERAALNAAAKFEEKGMLVLAVRPPTVAKGSSRLRVTLSCEHRDEEIAELIETCRAITPSAGSG
jgi:8-amino-7-oxononanoate synthase